MGGWLIHLNHTRTLTDEPTAPPCDGRVLAGEEARHGADRRHRAEILSQSRPGATATKSGKPLWNLPGRAGTPSRAAAGARAPLRFCIRHQLPVNPTRTNPVPNASANAASAIAERKTIPELGECRFDATHGGWRKIWPGTTRVAPRPSSLNDAEQVAVLSPSPIPNQRVLAVRGRECCTSTAPDKSATTGFNRIPTVRSARAEQQ